MLGTKYQVLGTSVLILEETDQKMIGEANRVRFVQKISHPHFGTGAGRVVFIPSSEQKQQIERLESNLNSINSLLSNQGISEAYLVRTFDSNGIEMPFSATALFALGDYFYRLTHKKENWFFGGLKTSRPNLHFVYGETNTPHYNVNLGVPLMLTDSNINPMLQMASTSVGVANWIRNIQPLITWTDQSIPIEFKVCDWGWPNFVCFIDHQESEQDDLYSIETIFDQPFAIQSGFFDTVNSHIKRCSESFSSPAGFETLRDNGSSILGRDDLASIVYVKMTGDQSLEARFFTGGRCRELHFSGLGAAAAVSIGSALGYISGSKAQVNGMINSSYGINTSAHVQKTGESWWIKASPELIWQGTVY